MTKHVFIHKHYCEFRDDTLKRRNGCIDFLNVVYEPSFPFTPQIDLLEDFQLFKLKYMGYERKRRSSLEQT